MGPSNTKIILEEKWFSNRLGFVDVQEIPADHFFQIYEYWFGSRRPQLVQKIQTTNAFLKRVDLLANISQIKEKNARRMAVIKIYDLLLNNENIKRL